MDDSPRAVEQASVKFARLFLGVGRPQARAAARKVVFDNHSISPSLRGRDDNAAVSAERRIGHRKLVEQNAFRYVSVAHSSISQACFLVKRPAARIEQAQPHSPGQA
jgi:hypothetical protein